MANIYGVQLIFILCVVSAVMSVIFVKKWKISLIPASLICIGLLIAIFGMGSLIASQLWEPFDAGRIIRDFRIQMFFFSIPGSLLFVIGIIIAAFQRELNEEENHKEVLE